MSASERVGPWLLIDAGLGEGAFNIGVLLEQPGPDLEEALALAEDWFGTRGLWHLRLDLRSDHDADMIVAGRAAGLVEWWSEPALLLQPLPILWPGLPRLDLREVRSRDDVEAYVSLEDNERDREFQHEMVSAALELEGFRLLLGFVDGRPVARSMAVVCDGMVGIHNVFVPPTWRNRGYGAAITVAAIEAGRALGAKAACLESTELGLPVYHRLGFIHEYDYVTLHRTNPPVAP
jgi:GNAT superfamily N-acetyltransferase